MVSIREERAVVAEMYPTRSWAKKVDQMPDHQVHAIYLKEVAKKNQSKDEDTTEEVEDIPF